MVKERKVSVRRDPTKEIERLFKGISGMDSALVERLQLMKISVDSLVKMGEEELMKLFEGNGELVELVRQGLSKYEMKKNVMN